MTRRPRRPFQRKPALPLPSAYQPLYRWPAVNRGFYADFRNWLFKTGYSPSALNLYGVAARLVFSLWDKPYWQLDPDFDLEKARRYIVAQYASAGTRQTYLRGVAKLEQYLRLRGHTPRPEKVLHWASYLGVLPGWMADDVRTYYAHCARAWPAERRYAISVDWVSQLTRPLRGMVKHAVLNDLTDLTPEVWAAYLDARLADGINPVTLNGELGALQSWLRFLAEAGQSVCPRLLRVQPLAESKPLPRDVPVEQLRRLLQAVEMAAQSWHAGVRRTGLMDRAWILLMLHSGLRAGEVRRMRLGDIDWDNRRVRIEQSKGLKDRRVCLSSATISAIKAYLAVRGPADALPDYVFIYRHASLSESYCGTRLLKYYRRRCGVRITPHQLRHSCATLLLNAGAPVLTVQTILGHKHIDTTLGYARLYDGTVAADYYRAMAQVEKCLNLAENAHVSPISHGELLALVDALRAGTLNESQAETVRLLRAGILALAEREAAAVDTAGHPG